MAKLLSLLLSEFHKPGLKQSVLRSWMKYLQTEQSHTSNHAPAGTKVLSHRCTLFWPSKAGPAVSKLHLKTTPEWKRVPETTRAAELGLLRLPTQRLDSLKSPSRARRYWTHVPVLCPAHANRARSCGQGHLKLNNPFHPNNEHVQFCILLFF